MPYPLVVSIVGLARFAVHLARRVIRAAAVLGDAEFFGVGKVRTIWKFELLFQDDQFVDMPIGANVVAVGMQHGICFVWAMVDSEASIEPRRVHIAGTGHPIPADVGAYVGMVFDGPFVWHVFA